MRSGDKFREVDLLVGWTDYGNNEWAPYADIIEGDPDHVHSLSFCIGRSSFHFCHCPVPTFRPDGQRAWRFQTRQRFTERVRFSAGVRGCGGTVYWINYRPKDPSPTHEVSEGFYERRQPRELKYQGLPEAPTYGLELELTSARQLPVPQLAQALEATLHQTIEVAQSHNHTGDHRQWKFVPDGSIVCSRSAPDCHPLELVSPILRGGAGLSTVYRVLQCLAQLSPRGALQVNRSMGFHVHVDVSGLSLQQLKNVCRNFIEYEDVFDSLMPPSRRTGSSESERYFRSNRDSVSQNGRRSLSQCRHAISSCRNMKSLVKLMNGDSANMDGNSRYYKLNLQNLITGRQPTIEFRQHSATMSYEKVAAWVRFCVAFVRQSAQSTLRVKVAPEDRLAALFHCAVDDRALRDFYAARRDKLAATAAAGRDDCSDAPCCDGCARGGGCFAGKGRPRRVEYCGLAIATRA